MFAKIDKPEVCNNCRADVLELRQFGYYCPTCLIYSQQLEIEHERLMVPANYRSNASEKKQSSRERNCLKYFNSLAQRYDVRGRTEMDNLVMQVTRYLGENKRCSSYWEVCAAIFYYNFRQELMLTARDFCIDNQVEMRRFNHALLKYVEVKNCDGSHIEKQPALQTNQPEQVFNQAQTFLKVIAPELFNFTVINNERLEQCTAGVLRKLRQQLTTEEDCYDRRVIACMIYKCLKQLNHPITISRYCSICKHHNVIVSKRELSRRLESVIQSHKQDSRKSELSLEPTNIQENSFDLLD